MTKIETNKPIEPIETDKSLYFSVDVQKILPKKFVIENKLSISYRKGKSMHYPELPKVTKGMINDHGLSLLNPLVNIT